MLLLNPGLGDRLLVAGTDQLLDSWEAPQEQRVQPVQWIPAGPEERAKGIRLRVQHDKVGARDLGAFGIPGIPRILAGLGTAGIRVRFPGSGWARHSWD